jgi:tRNA(Ile)-lysidine synthase
LLDVARTELEAYASRHGLSWVEDPSNDDHRYARNFLRQRVFPVLAEQWPQVSTTLARSAAHLSEAQGLLDELAQIDLARAMSASVFDWLGLRSLEVAPLRALSAARQRNALSHWLAPVTKLPDSDHWVGWDSLRDARDDGHPVWRLADGEMHRTGGRIWWLSDRWLQPVSGPIEWLEVDQPLLLPGNGRVILRGAAPSGALCIRYRQGGEIMELPGRGHRDLKRLLNESSVPAFVRGRLPLLYRGEQLLGLANLPGLDGDPNGTWQLSWQP